MFNELIDAECEEILSWDRATSVMRGVVRHYRFERSIGSYSFTAHRAAAAFLEKAHPTVVDPMNYAGVLIEWAEKEHWPWFWHGCRHQVLREVREQGGCMLGSSRLLERHRCVSLYIDNGRLFSSLMRSRLV